MISIILVMIGGGFGAITRSAITDYFNHKFTSKLPIRNIDSKSGQIVVF